MAERRHPATQERQLRARSMGHRPHSELLATALVWGVLVLGSASLFGWLAAAFQQALLTALDARRAEEGLLLEPAMGLLPLGWILLLPILAAVAAEVLQGGFRWLRGRNQEEKLPPTINGRERWLRTGVLSIAWCAVALVALLFLPEWVPALVGGAGPTLGGSVAIVARWFLLVSGAVLAAAFVLDAVFLRGCWLKSLRQTEQAYREEQKRLAGNGVMKQYRQRVGRETDQTPSTPS